MYFAMTKQIDNFLTVTVVDNTWIRGYGGVIVGLNSVYEYYAWIKTCILKFILCKSLISNHF